MQLKDIPIEALRANAERKALERYDRAMEIINGRPIPDFKDLKEMHGIDIACSKYAADPVVVDLKKAGILSFFDNIEEFRAPRTMIAERARAGVLCPFAIVYDGKWHERGSMGWWAWSAMKKTRTNGTRKSPNLSMTCLVKRGSLWWIVTYNILWRR